MKRVIVFCSDMHYLNNKKASVCCVLCLDTHCLVLGDYQMLPQTRNNLKGWWFEFLHMQEFAVIKADSRNHHQQLHIIIFILSTENSTSREWTERAAMAVGATTRSLSRISNPVSAGRRRLIRTLLSSKLKVSLRFETLNIRFFRDGKFEFTG